MSINNVVLVGRLTRDPELRYTPSGVATCTFTLAVDNPFSKTPETKADFLPIVVWRQLAETCANYLRKGRLCAIEGRLATRNYEKNGNKVYVTEIIASNVRFLERAERGEQQESAAPLPHHSEPGDFLESDFPF